MLEFPEEGVNLRKSALFCENLRLGPSILCHLGSVRHLKRALRQERGTFETFWSDLECKMAFHKEKCMAKVRCRRLPFR